MFPLGEISCQLDSSPARIQTFKSNLSTLWRATHKVFSDQNYLFQKQMTCAILSYTKSTIALVKLKVEPCQIIVVELVIYYVMLTLKYVQTDMKYHACIVH